MKIFIALVGLITLWSATLNSGSTTKIWVPPISDKQATILAPLTKTTDEKPSVVQMVNSEELECMSKNIYFEAAMESTAGKLAVAQVTMNRVNSSRYPNTVCKVITQGRHYKSGLPVKNRCQFSWYCDGKGDEPRNQDAWKKAQGVAMQVAHYGSAVSTGGATHYHAHYVTPAWAATKTKTAVFGDHIFYRWEK